MGHWWCCSTGSLNSGMGGASRSRRWLRPGTGSGCPTSEGIPTLILWGERDRYLSEELAPLSLERCDQGRLITFAEGTHWLQHGEPEAVNRALLEFLP
jgi:epoxide hydrolase 4